MSGHQSIENVRRQGRRSSRVASIVKRNKYAIVLDAVFTGVFVGISISLWHSSTKVEPSSKAAWVANGVWLFLLLAISSIRFFTVKGQLAAWEYRSFFGAPVVPRVRGDRIADRSWRSLVLGEVNALLLAKAALVISGLAVVLR